MIAKSKTNVKETLAFQQGLFSMLSPIEQITELVSQKFKYLQFIIQTRGRYSYKRLLGSDADIQRCFRNRCSQTIYYEGKETLTLS